MNFANNVIIRDGSGIFRSKIEVIDLASEGAMEIEGGEEEGEDDVCAQHIWLQTTFRTERNPCKSRKSVTKRKTKSVKFPFQLDFVGLR